MKVAAAVLLFGLCAWGQDEVHIVPREVPATPPVSEALAIPPDLVGQERIKVQVDLVLVPVSITDVDRNTPVTGLERAQFRLFEDRAEQQIRYFSSEDTPVSIGVVFDASGSMGLKVDEAKAAVAELSRASNPLDEMCLITFSDRVLATDFTTVTEDLTSRLLFTGSNGRTSLLDAVYEAVEKMRHARYQRKALIIISDGGDNHSRFTTRQIRKIIQESDVLVYSIGLFERTAFAGGGHRGGGGGFNGPLFIPSEELEGPQLLDDLASASGGRMFAINNPADMKEAIALVGRTLRNQYVLGYKPAHVEESNRFRKIKVKLQQIPHGWPLLRVDARQGFYPR